MFQFPIRKQSSSFRAQQDKKSFLLGVGCQKGGTTWLAHYLQGHPNVNLGIRKEYHIFDVAYLGICMNSYYEAKQDAASMRHAKDKKSQKQYVDVFSFYENFDAYFEYFDDLWRNGNSINVVGDITPSYAALPTEAFSTIREKIQRFNFRPRVLFLMRDPYDRVCSTARFNRRRRMQKGLELQTTLEDDIRAIYKKSSCVMRTEYDKTIENLESVFCNDEILISFYENLFHESEIRRIMEFLDLNYRKPDFGHVINASPEESQISDATRVQIVHHYKNTYKYVADKLGWDRVASVWPNIKLLEKSA